LRTVMYPLVSAEIPDFDLYKAIHNGMLPRHYTTQNPQRRMQAYIGDYLNEEIRAEALSRNLLSFTRFMEIAAQCSGEMIVYKNIAQDCGVSANTVKEYFQILEQTMVGYLISGFTATTKRRAISAPKFYYFDVGIVNYLLKRNTMTQGTDAFGHAFEHLLMQEIIAYLGYNYLDEKLTYWRTSGGYEVDCIIGNGRIAIEFKSCDEVKSRHTKGLKSFQEEYPQARLIIVSMDKYKRVINGIEIFPATEFLSELWGRKIV